MYSRKRTLTAAILLMFLIPVFLPAGSWVKVAKNPEEGWKLLVDGEQIAVHGVVWSFTPIGENYSYSLWDQPKELIQEMIDTDAALMHEMGVNAIRVFTDVPPEWISYLYQRYGIYTVVNDLFGRYGMSVDGRWYPRTNYADIRTRELILEQLTENVSRYVDVPGVLFYLLGNENNYGLEWDSDAIEDLPVGQRLEVRAGYLYSLFEEGIQIVKDIDPTKPVGIVNGDIQYMNLIDALVPSLDILGVNTYRGDAAQDLFYESVAETLDVPIVYTEFGADAFNVVEGREDQYHQASIIKGQWEEIYRQSYGKGGYQNTLGGFVFEWMDEWWKSAGMVEDLDVHNDDASWSNGAYAHDAAFGVNNMNEEWWGICAQSTVKTDGVHERRPRAAYYLLKDLWTLDQINSTPEEIAAHFDRDVQPYVNRGEIEAIRQSDKEDPVVDFRGKMMFVGNGHFTDIDMINGGIDQISTSRGQWAYLGLDISPFNSVDAGMTVRIQGEVPDTVFEQEAYSRYGSFTLDAASLTDPANPANNPPLPNQDFYPASRVEIYDGYFNWETDLADVDFYFHNGHTDWIAEGDYFGLLPEAFDFFGMDKEGSKAPFGAEFTGKDYLEGLKIYGGPEIYWGSDPQVMAKYYRENETLSWSLLYNQVVGADQSGSSNGYSQRASGWIGLNLWPWINTDLGVLFSGSEHLGDSYDHVDKNADGSYSVVPNQQINIMDTLAYKVDLSTELILYTKLFARYIYAGRVADSNNIITRDGTQTVDVGTGNRHEFQGGVRFQYGGLSVMPKFLARMPLSHPLPFASGGPRKSLFDPFAVYANREAYQV
ncbi:MAG: glycoside hydrolase family 2 TIM barrel-domain containing protein, partial [Spirochaetaceae bacterium]|nr:glycoside hydrolase family 2 TIM barrel-domain containing protein [Spirochaetaceae bacterium]